MKFLMRPMVIRPFGSPLCMPSSRPRLQPRSHWTFAWVALESWSSGLDYCRAAVSMKPLEAFAFAGLYMVLRVPRTHTKPNEGFIGG